MPEEDKEALMVPRSALELSPEQMQSLQHTIDPLQECTYFGVSHLSALIPTECHLYVHKIGIYVCEYRYSV